MFDSGIHNGLWFATQQMSVSGWQAGLYMLAWCAHLFVVFILWRMLSRFDELSYRPLGFAFVCALGLRGVPYLVKSLAFWFPIGGLLWWADLVATIGSVIAAGFAAFIVPHVLQMVHTSRENRLLSDQIRESEARFRGTFEQAAVGMLHVTQDGQFLRANQKACDIFGYEEHELLALRFLDITHPDDLEKGKEALAQMVSGEIPHCTFEKRYIRKDGVTIWGDLFSKPVRGDDGELLYLVSIVQDIEERKQARLRLQESEAILRETFEKAAVGIAHVGPDGHWLRVNQTLCDILGYGKDELTKLTFQDITHPDDLEKDLGLTNQLLNGEIERFDMEKRYIRKDGKSVWALLTVSLVRKESGEPWFFISVVEDLSELRAAHAELAHKTEDLLRMNEELDSFVYIASHDLQEPIRTITSFSELLIEDLGDDLDEDTREDIYFIRDAATRMRSLIQSLLELSRIGRVEFEESELELVECLEAAMYNLSQQIEEREAVFSIDDLPTVCGNEQLLTMLFQNLLSNGIKFTADGQPNLSVSSKREGDDWVVSVLDRGIGLDPAMGDQIFRPFKRLHGLAKFKGNGVGLAICKKIVQLHGGRIWVESTPGEGACFQFSLPMIGFEAATCEKGEPDSGDGEEGVSEQVVA